MAVHSMIGIRRGLRRTFVFGVILDLGGQDEPACLGFGSELAWGDLMSG